MNSPLYFDVSGTGCGKTYVSAYLARLYELDLLVVCPVNVVHKWEEVAKLFNVPITVLTYQKLAGRFCGLTKKLGHGFLEYVNNEYVCTSKLVKMCERGLYIVFDEFHNIIHPCARTFACLVLAMSVVKCKRCKSSKVAFLSATPFTKKSEMVWFLSNKYVSTMNIIGSANMIASRAITRGSVISNEAYSSIISSFINNDYETTFGLLSEKMKVENFSLMNIAIYDDYVGYSSGTEKAYIEDILGHISSLFTGADDNDLWKLIFMKTLNKYMCKLELAKKTIFANYISKFSTSLNSKLVIFVNYTDTLEYLCGIANNVGLHPQTISGRDNSKARQGKIREFQNGKSRALICNTKAASIGIDLDDKVGDSHRTLIISPSFDFTSLVQAIGRVYRIDTKSKPEVHFVYAPNERRLINNITRKKTFLTRINKYLAFNSLNNNVTM